MNAQPPLALAAGIDRFVLPILPVPSDLQCSAVYDRFVADGDLLAIPVCDDGRPVGLVDRYHFLRQLAHSYGRALFANKPVAAIMDRDPLVVERAIGINALQHLIADDRPSALTRGFVVVADGRYLGMGAALGLLRASLAESAAVNRRLETALEASESASRLKSRFFANLSHELRTPLNAIIGFAEVMAGGLMGPLDARYRGYAGDIHASGQHLLALINDLLDMAKIEAGEMQAYRQETDLGVACEGALRMVRAAAERARLVLLVEIDENCPAASVDARHLRQILLNLLSNAIKFTHAGGRIELRVRTGADGAAKIDVADSGIGMSGEDVALALKPFGQVANALSRSHDGTGLGLPLVKALCEINSIGFDLASAPGQGTRVTLDFAPAQNKAVLAAE